MNRKQVIAIFDIGKTNKKILLFDRQLRLVYQTEKKFSTTIDEDGFECDDIEMIEYWVRSTLLLLIKSADYDIKAVNFSTYGASLVFLDSMGKRLNPLYNYLKEIDPDIKDELINKYGGEMEFCRNTASPSLGMMLNSGIQMLWINKQKPDIFEKTNTILHFPQYLSFLFTKRITSEPTSIGCHTFMWDFDKNCYHHWLEEAGFNLPEPSSSCQTFKIKINGHELIVGIGIHDSSASLVPYMKIANKPFLLVSTGTWCINMNPFNNELLTSEQLSKDCLSYMSISQQPVKSSRLYLGYIHDINQQRIALHFGVSIDFYRNIITELNLLRTFLNEGDQNRIFFRSGLTSDFVDADVDISQFDSFSSAYHRLVFDLAVLNSESIDLIIGEKNVINQIFVSGGFARNEIFMRSLAGLYMKKDVYTSEIDNSSALGAALVIWDELFADLNLDIDLGLKKWNFV